MRADFFKFLKYFLAVPSGMKDSDSPTRDQTRSLHWKHRVLTTGPPGNSLYLVFKSLISFFPYNIQFSLLHPFFHAINQLDHPGPWPVRIYYLLNLAAFFLVAIIELVPVVPHVAYKRDVSSRALIRSRFSFLGESISQVGLCAFCCIVP